MFEIVLTQNREPSCEIWRRGAEAWSSGAEALEIQSVNWICLVGKTSISANDCYTSAWITDTQSCKTCLVSPLDLHKLSSVKMCWINLLRVSLNLLALVLMTGLIGTWIGSILPLLSVPSSNPDTNSFILEFRLY